MKLIRNVNLPSTVKRRIDGPMTGGTFWALDGAHDLPPGPMAFGDMAFMVANGKVWMTDAIATMAWTPIHKVADVPAFDSRFVDDFDGMRVTLDVAPFMPQFYFVPTNRRGRRFLDRTTNRAFAKIWR